MRRILSLLFLSLSALLANLTAFGASPVAAPVVLPPVVVTVPSTTIPAAVAAPRVVVDVTPVPAPEIGFEGRCGAGLLVLALEVGWPASELATLDRVAFRESGADCGNTGWNESWNRSDPMGGSRGTMQINGYWCSQVKYNPHPAGWLGEHGILDDCTDLFDTRINLTAALAIWKRSGWTAWSTY